MAVESNNRSAGLQREQEDLTGGVARGDRLSVWGDEEVGHLTLAGGLSLGADQSHLKGKDFVSMLNVSRAQRSFSCRLQLR